jgi:hypothetical protein
LATAGPAAAAVIWASRRSGRPGGRHSVYTLMLCPRCRVVALFSPATRDEAAADRAGFAGWICRHDFDPTSPPRTVNLLDFARKIPVYMAGFLVPAML